MGQIGKERKLTEKERQNLKNFNKKSNEWNDNIYRDAKSYAKFAPIVGIIIIIALIFTFIL